MYFHDPLVAAYLFADDICTFRRGRVHVGTGADWGRTYFIDDPQGNVQVADSIVPENFFRHYYEIVNADGKDV